MSSKRISRRKMVQATAAAGLGVVLPRDLGAQGARKPNILLVYADQHRHDALGADGNRSIATPALDRLAAEGTRFTRLWVQSPVCRSSRASFITGLYPHSTRITSNTSPTFDASWPTFMKNLQKAGYFTASLGKTHYIHPSEGESAPKEFAHDSRKDHPFLASFGFDYVTEDAGQWYPAMVGFSSPYTDYLREHGLLEKYRRQIYAVWQGTPHHWDAYVNDFAQEHDVTSFVARQVIDLIKTRDASKPFFIKFAPIKPHVPLAGDPIWAAHYRERQVPGGPRDHARGMNPLWERWLDARYRSSHEEGLTEEYITAGKRMYYAMISLVDQKVGEIIEVLRARGELDNTWILYSSDHGDTMGDHRLMGKMIFYHGAVSVPAIVRPPKKAPARRTVTAPVESIDLAATILDIAGAPPLAGSPAQSLLPLMNGAERKSRYAYSEIAARNDTPYFVSVTDGRYRYTVETGTGTRCELFDLAEDPDETRNLADDTGRSRLMSEMQGDIVDPHLRKAKS